MTKIITSNIPSISQKFYPYLLCHSLCIYNIETLNHIAKWLEKKISRREFRKYPSTIKKLKEKQQQFVELYEEAKIKEREAENKEFIKAKMPFYRPRLPNRNDQHLFKRLVNRRETSEHERKNSKI